MVVVVAVSRAASAVVLARCRVAGSSVVEGGLGRRTIMVGVGVCQSLGLGKGRGMIVGVAVVVGHAFRHGLMRRSVLRRACRQQRRHNARRHGRACQAPKDQHHHQQEEKAATHASMIRRGGPRFHRHALFWPGAPGQPAKDREGKPAQIVHAFLEHGQYHVMKHVGSHLPIFSQVPATVFPSVFLLHRKVGMPPWVAGMWSTLSARIRWLVLWATLPAVLLVVYQARPTAQTRSLPPKSARCRPCSRWPARSNG